MKSLVAILFVALFGCTLAQINVPGACRTLPVATNFNATRYEGVWYELKRYNFPAEADLDCSTADYILNDNGFDVINAGIDLVTSLLSFAIGRGYVAFPDEVPLRGLLNVTFSAAPADQINYQVVETDYENYALVWDCVDQNDGTSNEYAWVLARGYEVSGDQQDRVDELVALYLDESQLRVTVQDQLLCLGGEVSPAPAQDN